MVQFKKSFIIKDKYLLKFSIYLTIYLNNLKRNIDKI